MIIKILLSSIMLCLGRGEFAFALTDPPPIKAKRVINRALHEWESQQVEEPCVLVNPKNPNQLIMFYSGVPASNQSKAYIGKAWASVDAPLDWHEDKQNPIFKPSEDGWDSGSIRLDSVVYVAEEDSYYIYYSGTQGAIQDRIGLAIVPAGADGYSGITPRKILRYDSKPVLVPENYSPFNETMVSQGAVMREWNVSTSKWEWYMYYSYRGTDGVLPGIRLAFSRDGKRWSKRYNFADPQGMGQIFTSTSGAYYEWHQIFKVGSTYVLSIEVGPHHGERWRAVFAASLTPTKGWQQLEIDTALQTKWAGLYSDQYFYHVATPALYQVKGKWYLFVQAAARPDSGNYIDGRWDLWVIESSQAVSSIPGGDTLFIPEGRDSESVPSEVVAPPMRKVYRSEPEPVKRKKFFEKIFGSKNEP